MVQLLTQVDRLQEMLEVMAALVVRHRTTTVAVAEVVPADTLEMEETVALLTVEQVTQELAVPAAVAAVCKQQVLRQMAAVA
jgi:hypothetical protein